MLNIVYYDIQQKVMKAIKAILESHSDIVVDERISCSKQKMHQKSARKIALE